MKQLITLLNRCRTIAFIGWLILVSGELSALEVGELRMLSHLGEPLSAQLQLNEHEEFNTQNLTIKLAPAEIVKKIGADGASFPQDIRFSVDSNGLVKITTGRALKEPYLNFIVQFRWPEGELYKEFSVLVDPD